MLKEVASIANATRDIYSICNESSLYPLATVK